MIEADMNEGEPVGHGSRRVRPPAARGGTGKARRLGPAVAERLVALA